MRREITQPKQLLFVVEANKATSEHASFNAAMIGALYAHSGGHRHRILLFCESAHRQALLSLDASLATLRSVAIPVISGLKRAFVRKFAVELFVTVKILLKARRHGAKLVFLSVFPNVLPFILLLRPVCRGVPVHIVLHGELESLLVPAKQRIYREGFWVRLALLRMFRGDWPHLYVLGHGIRRRLLDLSPHLANLRSLKAIEHPYTFTPRAASSPATRGEKRRVAFVGAGRRVKGITDFFELASSLAGYITAGRLEFVLIGGLERGLTKFNDNWVTVLAPNAAGLTAQEYQRQLSEVDCALFLSHENYRLTASGSVFDAINEGVEILSLKTDYLVDLSQIDTEGAMKFFDSAGEIEAEIRRRLEQGWPRRRFAYPQIKHRHSHTAEHGALWEALSIVRDFR